MKRLPSVVFSILFFLCPGLAHTPWCNSIGQSRHSLGSRSVKVLRPRGDRSSPASSSHGSGSPPRTTPSASSPKDIIGTKGKVLKSPSKHTKKELMKAHPVSLALQIHGPATVKGWEGKKGTVIPKIPADKSIRLELVHPKSATVDVEHHGDGAETYAFAMGKVTRAAGKLDIEKAWNPYAGKPPKVRIYSLVPDKRPVGHNAPTRGETLEDITPVPWKKINSQDIKNPSQLMGGLRGYGNFAIEAQNHDSGSESDG